MKTAISIIVAILLLSSCNKNIQECFVPRSVSTKVFFRVLDTLVKEDANGFITRTIEIRDTTLNRPSLRSLGQDTNITFQGERGIKDMFLFLNADTTSIQYVFQRSEDASVTDTLTIDYDPYTQFISNACGYTFVYKLKTVSSTKLNIKDAFIEDPDVTLSAQAKNIIIYIPKQ